MLPAMTNRLREIVDLRETTYEQVAYHAGVSLRTVTRLAQGHNVTLKKAEAIAKALSVSVGELFEEVPA